MSGVGRGRGWLNINKTKPGIVSPVENNTYNYDFISTLINSTPTRKSNAKETNIISKIAYFDENDDGILMNQKIKAIMEEFHKECSVAEDVEDVFVSIYDSCLQNEQLASQAIAMVSAPSFNVVNVHGVKIRNLFITQFQKDFEDSKQLQMNDPKAFRNAVKMLGEFYHKARLIDGQQLKFLSSPIVKYLEMLLESATELDLQLFTTQLYMNGKSIKEELPSTVNDLFIHIRNLLAHNDGLTSISKLWLLLAIDIANNRYNFPPTELHQYYVKELGDEAIGRIKKLDTELSIQINVKNIKLDNIQSNVSVLQQVSSSSDNWETPSSTTSTSVDTSSNSGGGGGSEKRNFKDQSFNNIGTWEQPKNEKTPRPILGVGSRLKHEQKNVEHHQDWKENNSSGWDNNKKKNWSNPQKKNVNKGWEHDDRFDNEYE